MQIVTPVRVVPEIYNKYCEFYEVNSSFQLTQKFLHEDKFRIFRNGFKIIMIHNDDHLTIRHIYIDESEMEKYISDKDVLSLTIKLLRGHYNCELVVTSDIHLQKFQLQLINAMALNYKYKHAVIAGDIFYKFYSRIPFSSQPSRVEATEKLIIYINKYVKPNLLNGRLIWLRGNHDSSRGWYREGQRVKLDKIIPKLMMNSITYRINETNFHIRHGAIEDHLDHRYNMNYKDVHEFRKLYTGNNFLILGHSCQYMHVNDNVNEVVYQHRGNIYINDRYDIYEVSRNQIANDGIYKIDCYVVKKYGNQVVFYLDDEEIGKATLDKPIYVNKFRSSRSMFPIIDQSNLSSKYCAVHFHYISEMEKINSNSHLLCLNNIRCKHPLYPDDAHSDVPKFVSYGMIMKS